MVLVGVVEHGGQAFGAVAGGLRARVGLVVVGGLELVVPTEARLEARGGIHDAVPPVDAHQALAAELRGAVHVRLEAVDVELRQPHAGVVFEPRNGPALAAFQLRRRPRCTGSQPSESLRQAKTISLGSFWWNISKLRATPPQPESTSRFLGALRLRKS